jgi:hypothetical protein
MKFACASGYVKHFCSLVVLLQRSAVGLTGFVLCVVLPPSSSACPHLVRTCIIVQVTRVGLRADSEDRR